MKNFEIEEKLKDLASGELSSQERTQLLEEAANSKELEQEVLFSQKLSMALRHKELLEVNNILKATMLNEPLPEPAVGNRNIWALMIGFMIVSTLSIGIYAVGNQQNWWQSQEQRLFSQYFQPMENIIFMEGSDSFISDNLKQGMEAYDSKNYKDAIKKLNAYYELTKDANGGLFLGVSYLLDNQIELAISTLNKVIPNLEAVGQEAANWYLSLAYLKNGDKVMCKKILEEMPNNSLYEAEKESLLKKL